ncbi:MAG: hypothetical protein AABZ12_07995 [Planctomycetota bacterium]
MRGFSHLHVAGLRRLFWLLLAVCHAPVLAASWQKLLSGEDALGPCLVLTLVILFFGLKLVDVAALRVRKNRRAYVALWVVVAFLHVDVHESVDGRVALVEGVTAVVAASLLAAKPSVRRVIEVLGARPGGGRVGLSLYRSHETVWFDAFRPHCWALAFQMCRPHAPPA